MKRMIAILLAVMMLTAVFTACSSTIGYEDGMAYGNVSTTPDGRVNGGERGSSSTGSGIFGNGGRGNYGGSYNGGMGGTTGRGMGGNGSTGSGMGSNGSTGSGMTGGR